MNPHNHEWRLVRSAPTGTLRECQICGERQRRVIGSPSWGAESPKTGKLDHLRVLGRSPNERVADHGGVVGYDPATAMVTTGSGLKFSFADLARANTSIPLNTLRRALEGVAAESEDEYDFEGLAEAIRAGAMSAEAAAEALKKMSAAAKTAASGYPYPYPSVSVNPPKPKKWTSDDALELILEEIKHAPDVMKAAGEWITKVTNGITDITRNLDE